MQIDLNDAMVDIPSLHFFSLKPEKVLITIKKDRKVGHQHCE